MFWKIYVAFSIFVFLLYIAESCVIVKNNPELKPFLNGRKLNVLDSFLTLIKLLFVCFFPVVNVLLIIAILFWEDMLQEEVIKAIKEKNNKKEDNDFLEDKYE